MEYSRDIPQKKALKTLRKIIHEKKIVLESIREGVSTVELKKKGINIVSPL